jgi:hypothetical protein
MITSTFITIATILTMVNGQALTLCAWSDTLGCDNVGVCCSIGVNNCCGNIPQGFGFSISYAGLPGPVSDGQAWTSTDCTAGGIITQQIGTGDKCWVGAGLKASSMAWTHAASKRDESESLNARGSISVASPDIFRYSVNNVAKAIKFPDGDFDKIYGFYKAGNYSALGAYPPA